MGTESFVNTADCEFRGISYKRISIGNFTKLALLSSGASWLCRTNPLSLFTRRSFPGESALIFPPPLWRRRASSWERLRPSFRGGRMPVSAKRRKRIGNGGAHENRGLRHRGGVLGNRMDMRSSVERRAHISCYLNAIRCRLT
jgi:hypothetical protein